MAMSMEEPTTSAPIVPAQSRIPRPSRLPIRSAGPRPSTSFSSLKRSSQAQLSAKSPTLRSAISKDGLRGATAQTPVKLYVERHASIVGDQRHAAGPATHAAIGTQADACLTSQDVELDINTSAIPVSHGGGAQMVSLYSRGSRKPRPSLSERTMETLAQVPSSPAVRKRNSSFFNTMSPMRPSSQSNTSRPGTSSSDAAMGPPPSSKKKAGFDCGAGDNVLQSCPSNVRAFSGPPQVTKSLGPATPSKTPLKMKSHQSLPRSSLKLSSTMTGGTPAQEISPSRSEKVYSARSVSKSASSRPIRPRASAGNLFRKPSWQNLDKSGKPSEVSPTCSDTSVQSAASDPSKASSVSSLSHGEIVATPRKSSAALREQIAKAKAARKAHALATPADSADNPLVGASTMPHEEFDFGLSHDPFNQNRVQDFNKELLRKRVASARADGRLNISGLALREIPEEVTNMYNLDSIASGSWAESVDLTKFLAADNELEELSDDLFLDMDREAFEAEEETKGNQFGGLEILDLHGNLLKGLPSGLKRLEFLTSLNLSNNKLGNDCLGIVSQIQALRELRIAGNALSGELPTQVTQMVQLEVLQLQNNTIERLPENFASLVHLRVLNIAGNHFISVPFNQLEGLPLIDLDMAKNKLTASLVELDNIHMPRLQSLNVTGNQLESIGRGSIGLPALQHFSCTANRITELPDLSSWTSLITLSANDNNIKKFPDGLTGLLKVKNVDLSGNDIVVLDDRLALMESLENFSINGNPLREKKFSSMSTEDLKRSLKARLAPEVEETVSEAFSVDSDNSFATAPSPTPKSPMTAQFEWPVRSGGVLNGSSTRCSSLNPVAMSQIAASNIVKVVELRHNAFKEIPMSIAFFANTLTSLSLAHNELTSDTFLTDELELPELVELNLSSNTFNTLRPLTKYLYAPALQRLDISFNRLTALPLTNPLKESFPALTTLQASNNTIRELLPENIRGMEVVDCSSNELNSLNARIGLCEGLRMLNVQGNRFRVPKYTVLDKGTDFLLAWLRDRIPAGEAD